MKSSIAILMMMLGAGTLPAQWPQITQTARPWTRWWWMGSAVDSTGIARGLQQFSEAGIGGVEIVPIYGARGEEHRFREYLSPSWMRMLDYTVIQAGGRDMGVYLAVGTGWPVGGPDVKPEDAATKLIVQQYEYSSTKTEVPEIKLQDAKQQHAAGTAIVALTAYGPDGTVLDITDKISKDGTLSWKPASGTWKLYAAFAGKTLQKVKRAAPGGQGFTLDHFSATALPNYLKIFDRAFEQTAHGVKAFYNDSYEVYNADWTHAFFEEFKKRRGYDLRLHIDLLVSKDSSDAVAKIKSDYRETMSDLMLDYFSRQLNDWSHRKGALSLNQAHGSPANLLDLYAAVDIAETESFGAGNFDIKGWYKDSGAVHHDPPDLDIMKFASSAAHIAGHNLVSCETFTWLGEHFKSSWAQCKPEAEAVWLAGINHIFFHGSTYSPEDVSWPGWLFYASTEFNPGNSLWPHISGMNNYIARCQAILQQGKPDNEVLLYWPVYDAWHKARGMDMPFRVHNVDQWLHNTGFYEDIRWLQQEGYAADFASDRMLSSLKVNNGFLIGKTEGAAQHKVLLIPACSYMPLSTLKAIVDLAHAGATVVMQSLPVGMPGFHHSETELQEWNELIASLGVEEPAALPVGSGKIIRSRLLDDAFRLTGVLPENLVQTGLKFIRRDLGQEKYYFLVNHTAITIDTTVVLQYKAKSVQLLDPQTGTAGWVAARELNGGTAVSVQLKSGESLFLLATGKTVKGKPWQYYKESGTSISLDGPWKLHFATGGPSLPADRTLQRLGYWTLFDDAKDFSGTAAYSSSFRLDRKEGERYQLELNDVHESARVWINGKDAGILWANPFECDISPYLKSGRNDIRIEIVNLMANRIRYMDRKKISWRNYHEINFVNIDYKPFDASGWDTVPSGISGPVKIRVLQEDKRL